jgi:hypothetical protein
MDIKGYKIIKYDGSFGDLLRVAEEDGYEEPDPVDPRYDDADDIEEDIHDYFAVNHAIALTQEELDSGDYQY